MMLFLLLIDGSQSGLPPRNDERGDIPREQSKDVTVEDIRRSWKGKDVTVEDGTEDVLKNVRGS